MSCAPSRVRGDRKRGSLSNLALDPMQQRERDRDRDTEDKNRPRNSGEIVDSQWTAPAHFVGYFLALECPTKATSCCKTNLSPIVVFGVFPPPPPRFVFLITLHSPGTITMQSALDFTSEFLIFHLAQLGSRLCPPLYIGEA